MSPRMLRHYDEIGVLRPSTVDAVTGYRSYAVAQLATLHRLVALRDLGFGLEDIKKKLDEELTVGELAWYDEPTDYGSVVAHAGFEIEGQRFTGDGHVAAEELPVIEVASVIHRGWMDHVEPVYEGLVQWIEGSGYQLAGRSRELYREFHEDDLSRNVTELQMPISC